MKFESDVINALIERYNLNSYLEIGVANPENTFNNIKAVIKEGVDIMPEVGCKYTMTSDHFFELYANDKKYDVIFVDGLHTVEQVYKDVKNSMKHLNDEGFIILDDCNPPTKSHASPQYMGGEWNGTVYQAFIQLKYELKDWSCFVVNGNWGLGILTKRSLLKNELMPFDPQNYLYDNFNIFRQKLLQLISYDEFKKILNSELIPMRKSAEDKQGLIDLCKEFPKNALMAEIGCYAGESTKIFLESGKIKLLYAIDPWQSGYDDSDPASSSDFSKVEKTFNKNVKGYKIKKMKMTFFEAFDLLPQLDVIYIDGSHQYEDVLNDINLALKKIKPGGIICGHDFHSYTIDTVQRAVKEKFGKPDKIFMDSSWAIIR